MRVIASQNGLEATRLAYGRLLEGADPLDAVVDGIALVENDPKDITVGYGGLPNEDGVVQLDAAVMHGPTHRAGGVAALEGIRHPAQVARLVMQLTTRTLLVGEGAKKFALANGFREENLLTEEARARWLHWKRSRSHEEDWLAPKNESYGRPEPDHQRPTGTVHVSALNDRGEISCATSTSGHGFKMAGRVGDSPIIGAGLYVDNALGSCGSVGWGEANVENLSSFAAVELLRQGKSPLDAGLEILRRISAHAHDYQRDEEGRPTFNVRLFILAANGNYAGVTMWAPEKFAVTDERGSRLEDCVPLFER